jgi:hypothetical protein
MSSNPPAIETITANITNLQITIPAQTLTTSATGSGEATLVLNLESLAAALAPYLAALQTVIPPATSLTDTTGAKWTLVSGIAERNGVATVNGVILILLFNGIIYAENNKNAWYSWTNSSWLAVSGDPRQ